MTVLPLPLPYIHVHVGDARNDIYVTLESGSFSKGTKTAERNVEVAINVVDSTGKVIPVRTLPPPPPHYIAQSPAQVTFSLMFPLQRSIVMGAGAVPIHEYESFIYYHNNNPKWNETFKVSSHQQRPPATDPPATVPQPLAP